MTVAPAKERRDKRTFRFAPDGARSYRRTFLVITDTKTDGPQAILNAEDLPRHLDAYSVVGQVDNGALAVGVTCRQLPKTPLHWEVTVIYESDIGDKDKLEQGGGADGGVNIGDPLLEPAVVTFGFEVFRIVATEDVGGPDPIALVSSSEQPFEPPLMIDDSRPVLTVERNERAFDPLQAIQFKDTVNRDAFLGAEAETVKVKGITAVKQFQPANPDVAFWRVVYIFLFKREGWRLRPLDTGTRVRAANGVDFEPYTEDGVVTEVRLDGAGNKLGEGEKDVFLDFTVYELENFEELNIERTLGIPGFNP